ncbi:hypothetical protein TNCV_388091 [Trichonephila clavipes]|nr:hypothetical protein TNCV_388091 [Trichonephila clavipes]
MVDPNAVQNGGRFSTKAQFPCANIVPYTNVDSHRIVKKVAVDQENARTVITRTALLAYDASLTTIRQIDGTPETGIIINRRLSENVVEAIASTALYRCMPQGALQWYQQKRVWKRPGRRMFTSNAASQQLGFTAWDAISFGRHPCHLYNTTVCRRDCNVRSAALSSMSKKIHSCRKRDDFRLLVFNVSIVYAITRSFQKEARV